MHRRTALISLAAGLLAACTMDSAAGDAREPELRVVRNALDGGTDMEPNTPPTAVDDAITVSEDETIEIEVLDNDVDPDGDELTVFIRETASEGTLVAGDGNFVYAPRPNFAGSDSFRYGVLDGRGGTAEATVAITVAPVNDAPVFIAPTPPNFGTVDAAVGVRATFQMAAEDVESDALTFGFEEFGATSEPSVANATFEWTPETADVGLHDVTIFVTDGTDRAERQLTFDVAAGPDAPDVCGTDRCADDETCIAEECVRTCSDASECDDGQACLDERCGVDPCAGITCSPGESCAGGACFVSCETAAECPAGLDCYGGRCAEDPCDGVSCGAGEACFAGRCGARCSATETCGEETNCYVGVCLGEVDALCDTVSCAGSSTCEGGLCTVCEGGDCGDDGDPQFESGGCGCSQASVPGDLLPAMLLLAFFARRRVRRLRRTR